MRTLRPLAVSSPLTVDSIVKTKNSSTTQHSQDILSGVLLDLRHLHDAAGSQHLCSRQYLTLSFLAPARSFPLLHPILRAGPGHYARRCLLPENSGKNLAIEVGQIELAFPFVLTCTPLGDR